jgi:predicted secreted protein
MVRPVQLAAWLLIGASVMACSNRMPSAPANPQPQPGASAVPTQTTSVTPSDTPFTLNRGQTFTVGLKSSGDGGYQWHLVESYDTRVVRLKGQRTADLPQNAPLGKFADELYDFEGLAPGQTTLTFALYRSWEGPTKAAETRRYPVTIQ